MGIVDDNVAELTERFSVKLNRTDGLDERITLDPVVAEIEIIDNDGEWMNNVITVQPSYIFRFNFSQC